MRLSDPCVPSPQARPPRCELPASPWRCQSKSSPALERSVDQLHRKTAGLSTSPFDVHGSQRSPSFASLAAVTSPFMSVHRVQCRARQGGRRQRSASRSTRKCKTVRSGGLVLVGVRIMVGNLCTPERLGSDDDLALGLPTDPNMRTLL